MYILHNDFQHICSAKSPLFGLIFSGKVYGKTNCKTYRPHKLLRRSFTDLRPIQHTAADADGSTIRPPVKRKRQSDTRRRSGRPCTNEYDRIRPYTVCIQYLYGIYTISSRPRFPFHRRLSPLPCAARQAIFRKGLDKPP